MLHSAFLIHSLGSLAAFLIAFALWSLAKLFLKNSPALALPLVIIVLGSLHQNFSMLGSANLVLPVALPLFCIAFFINIKPTIKSARSFRLASWELPFLAALIFLVVFSGFPNIRTDATLYHAWLGKIIELNNGYPKTMLPDYVFFSGSFEHLLAIFKPLIANDLVFLSMSYSLTFFLLSLGLSRLLAQVQKAENRDLPLLSSLALTVFIIFSLPEFDALLGIKPDGFLLVCGLALFTMTLNSMQQSKANAFLIGFYLVAPLALKLTWLLFSASFALVLIKDLARKTNKAMVSLLLGMILGFIVIVPRYLNSWIRLKNPLFPLQIGPFTNADQSEGMRQAWVSTVGSTSGVTDYLEKVFSFAGIFLWQNKYFILPVIFIIFAKRMMPKDCRKFIVFAVALFCLYALISPFIFSTGASERYFYPLSAAFIVMCVSALRHLDIKPAVLFLFLPVVLSSQIIGKSAYIFNNYYSVTEEGMIAGESSMSEINPYLALEKHREKLAGGNGGFSQMGAITEQYLGYFISGHSLSLDDPTLARVFYQSDKNYENCPWRFLLDYNFNYLVYRGLSNGLFKKEFLHSLTMRATEVIRPHAVYYFSHDTIGREIANDSKCKQAI